MTGRVVEWRAPIAVAVGLALVVSWATSAQGRSVKSAPFLAPVPLRDNAARSAGTWKTHNRQQARRLSNETTHSEWAYVIHRARARTRPDRRSRILHRFRRCDRFGC